MGKGWDLSICGKAQGPWVQLLPGQCLEMVIKNPDSTKDSPAFTWMLFSH